MEAWRDELYHHGIKGQKWGIRRYQNPDGTLTEAGKRRLGKNVEKKILKASKSQYYDRFREQRHIAKDLKNTEEYRQYAKSDTYNTYKQRWNAYNDEYRKQEEKGREQYFKKNGEPKTLYDVDVMDAESQDYGMEYANKYFRTNANGKRLMSDFMESNDAHNTAVERFVNDMLASASYNTRDLMTRHIIDDPFID